MAEGGIFPVRRKHKGVGLSGRWKAVNFGANYREADRCIVLMRDLLLVLPQVREYSLSISRQAHDTREQEDKDVRTSNYTPGTCEIGALEVLVKNNAPRR